MLIDKFLSFILLILIILCIYKNGKLNQSLKNSQIKKERKHLNCQNNSKSKNSDFFREMLNLYIDNREKFYLSGRKFIMKSYGKNYDENNIITIQDKLNYLLVHESPENKTECVDKILLRNYSRKILGKDIGVPILKIYNNTDEINLDDLPEKFVLKCNHGSGMNIVCKNKTSFNLEKAKENLKNWMGINYGLLRFEYQYINVKRKIFVEKFLTDDIIDYKFNCYNGEPKFVRVKKHVNGININNIYDMNWNLTDIDFNYSDFVRDPLVKFEKPVNFEKMKGYSRLLSSKFCFCRVDFYEVDKILYLGELTFAPANVEMKYNSKEMSIYLGNILNISKIKNN